MVSHDYGDDDLYRQRPRSNEVNSDLATIGNGDLEQGKRLVAALAARLTHARTKHPEFAVSKVMAWHVINSETNELCQAVCCESTERVQDELLDVLATSVRMYFGESGQDAGVEIGMAAAGGATVLGLAGPLESPGLMLHGAINQWAASVPELLTLIEALIRCKADLQTEPACDFCPVTGCKGKWMEALA